MATGLVCVPLLLAKLWAVYPRLFEWPPVRDLLALVAAPPHSRVRFESLQPQGFYRQAVLPAAHGRDPLSLLALRLNGHRLDLDHGYPCRLFAPNPPGVMQTKWVSRMVVLP